MAALAVKQSQFAVGTGGAFCSGDQWDSLCQIKSCIVHWYRVVALHIEPLTRCMVSTVSALYCQQFKSDVNGLCTDNEQPRGLLHVTFAR